MEWVIGGLIAMLVGAGMNAYATNSANKKAQARLKAAQYELGTAQDKINQQIAAATAEYESGKRVQNQAEEADRISSDIKSDVAESQAIRDSQQETQGNVSNDYTQARATAQQKTVDNANAFADLIGKIRSANTLRLNEGYKLNRYGENIGQLAKNARGNYAVGQAEAQQALHSKDTLKTWGQVIQAIGAAASMYGAVAAAPAAAAGASGSAAGTGITAAGNGAAGLSATGAGASGLQATGAASSALANATWGTGATAAGTAASNNAWALPYLVGGGNAAMMFGNNYGNN